MSLYTFATANFITPDDYKRRPVLDVGTLIRTTLLCLACAAALATLYSGSGDISATTASIAGLR